MNNLKQAHQLLDEVKMSSTEPSETQLLMSELARLQRIVDRPITKDTPLYVIFDRIPDSVNQCGLQDLLGEKESSPTHIFLNESAAERHASRQGLLLRAKMQLCNLNHENLELMADALEEANIEELCHLIEQHFEFKPTAAKKQLTPKPYPSSAVK